MYDAAVTCAAGISTQFLEFVVDLSPLYSLGIGLAFAGAMLKVIVDALR